MANDQTHEGLERFLTAEQLVEIRKSVKGKRLMLRKTGDEDFDVRLETFMFGAMFMVEALKHHKIAVSVSQRDLLIAAVEFYPAYEPLPEPTKNNAAGNAPPLRTIHKG